MLLLPDIFTVLRYCGVWPSTEDYIGWKQKLYDFYTLLMTILVTSFFMSGAIELFIFTHNVDELVKNGFLQLTMTTIFLKLIAIITERTNIRKILEVVEAELCRAKNEEEEDILHEWDPQTSSIVQGRRWMTVCVLMFTLVRMIKTDIPSRALPFSGWFPYDHTDNIGYWSAALYQFLVFGVSAAIGSTTDVVVASIMMQTCAQLNILKCRLSKIPEMLDHDIPSSNNQSNINEINDVNDENYKQNNIKEWERKIIKNCIQHHLLIVQFAETGNNTFANIIFLQFFASGLILSVSAQLLTKLRFMSSEYLFLVSYLGNMLVQIFTYCWYGNEVILQSSNINMAIFEMDWTKVPIHMQKDLMMIMVRSVHPIQFTSGHMLTLSIESFNSLLKTSYSVYNLLNQAS